MGNRRCGLWWEPEAEDVSGGARAAVRFGGQEGRSIVDARTGAGAGAGGRGSARRGGTRPEDSWTRLSAGDGSKGPRLYDWALVELFRLQLTEEEKYWGHWLLVRRNPKDPEELAYYVVFAPKETTTLEEVVRVAGTRWQIESCFESAKGEFGLDEYEVRKWEAWHRHVTLSLLAHAFSWAWCARERRKRGSSSGDPDGDLCCS